MRSISSYKEFFDDIEPEYQSDRISIAKRKTPKILFAIYTPSPWEYILSFGFILIILLYLLSELDKDGLTIFILILALLFLFRLIFITRSITTVIDLGEDKQHVYIKKHGLFDSELNSSLEIISVSNVKNIVMKRHVSRYRDSFEVLLIYDYSRRIPLTGRSLTFEECQIFAEIINKFLKIKDSVIAVD